jgi:hypothetical protein
MLPTYNPADLTKRPARTSTDSNSLVVVGETIALTAAQAGATGLIGKGVNIPKNAEIAWVMLDATDMDTNGAPAITISLGDAASQARLLAANAIAQSGAATVGPTIAKTGFGYVPGVETVMGAFIAVAAATGAAGTVKYAIAYVSN